MVVVVHVCFFLLLLVFLLLMFIYSFVFLLLFLLVYMLFLLFLVVVVVNVGHRNLSLKFGQNWVNNKRYVVDVVIVLVLLIEKPSFKTWTYQVINS